MSRLPVIALLILLSSWHILQGQSNINRNALLLQPVLLNPATCGADGQLKMSLSYERQWLTISNSPALFYASGEFRLGNFDFYTPEMRINDTKFRSRERVGLGAGIYSDSQGPFYEINLPFTYSYHVPLSEETSIAFGMTLKLDLFGSHTFMMDPIDPNDPLLQFENYLGINTNAGAYLYHEDFFAGISGVNLINNQTGSVYLPSLNQVVYGIAGYRFGPRGGSLFLEPALTMEYRIREQVFRPDFHLRLYFTRLGWMSLSYVDMRQVSVILALKFRDHFYFGYTYSMGGGKLGNYTFNTHGIVLGINLGMNPKTAVNPSGQ